MCNVSYKRLSNYVCFRRSVDWERIINEMKVIEGKDYMELNIMCSLSNLYDRNIDFCMRRENELNVNLGLCFNEN